MATSFRAARVLLQPRDSVKWRSRDGTVFERNTDAVEDFHFVNGSRNVRSGRRRLQLTLTVKLGADPGQDIAVEHARAAWIALRQRHPAIASSVQGSKRVYQQLEPGQGDTWLNKTFVSIPGQREITPELLDSLPATDMPAMYFLPDSKIVALRTSQHLMDAYGGAIVLNDFLDELSRLIAKDTNTEDHYISSERSDNLACSLKEAASLPSASIPQIARLWNVRRRWLRKYPTVGIAADQVSPQSGRSAWSDLEYSPSGTKELVKKARKHKMTVTHVVHAGVAFAAKEYGPFTLTKNYNTVVVVDMRRRFTDKDSTKTNAVSAQHAMWPISVPVTTFWKTAEALKQTYQDVVSDRDLPALAERVFAEVLQGSPSACPSFYTAPFVGSCGVIDDYLESSYGGLTVDDFSLSAECSGEEVVVAVWSYRGRLRLRAMFNEGYHSAKSIERYLNLTAMALRDGLGVSRSCD
ncbi:hypothetical protein BJX76DRAFT_24783 [Aspergillus varians]